MLVIITILVLVFCVLLATTAPRTALLVSIIASVLCCFAAWNIYVYGDNPAFIAGLLIFPVTLVVAVIRLYRDKNTNIRWPATIAKAILTGLGYLILLVILVAIFKPLGLIFFAMFVSAMIAYKVTIGYTLTLHVISTIGSAMRQNLPLAMALSTAAGDNTDRRSQILRNVSKWLTQGHPLSHALKRGYTRCPGNIAAMITAAEKVDQLPQAIESIEADLIEKADQSSRIQPVSLAYPLIVLMAAFSIVTVLTIKIIPIFAEVLSDMSQGKAHLPGATQFLLNMADFLLSGNGINLFLLIAGALIIMGFAAYIRKRPRRPEQPYLVSRVGDFLKWHLPVLHWFEMNYSLAAVVSLLRVSLRAGCTVDRAIGNTVGLDINCCFRKRLDRWRKAVEAGENISESAQRNGVGKTLAWAFNERINQGNTLEILATLDEFYRCNYNYKANLAKSVAMPFMILGLGGTVGFVVYAVFIPMVAITSYVANDVMP